MSFSLLYDFNPRSPSGLRLVKTLRVGLLQAISIHAARVGCDDSFVFLPVQRKMISIHAARVGCDRYIKLLLIALDNFNPRSPSGLPPFALCSLFCLVCHFNPRSPSGLRPLRIGNNTSCADISIHAARVGCDTPPNKLPSYQEIFQSTQPEWAATYMRRS